MTQKDFKIKKGLVVGGNIASNTNGFVFDYVANSLSVGGAALALQANVDLVQDNVAAIVGGSTAGIDLVQDNLNVFASNAIANTNTVSSNVDALTVQVNANLDIVSSNVDTLETSVNTIKANVDTVSANVDAVETRVVANINVVSSNVDTLETSVNTIKANVDTVSANVDAVETRATANINIVQDNVASAISTAAANDYVTYIQLNSNINVVSSNVDSLELSVDTIQANVNAVQDNVAAAESNIAAIIDGTTPFTGIVTMQQDLIVDGDLTVGGTTTAIQSTDTQISDRVIILSNGASAASFDTGLLLTRGSDGNVFVGFDETADQFIAAYTSEGGANTVTDFTVSAYANAHFDNIIVEGTVDGVDIAALSSGVDGIQANINSVSANVDTLETSVNTIKANVDSVASNVATVSTNVDTVSSNVDSLETSVNTIRANVNSVQDNVASIIDGSTAFTGAVTFNDNISADRAILNTQLQIGSNVTTGVGATQTTVFTFPGATYRGAELLMMVQDITNTEYQLSKILVVHDGTNVYTTEYGVLYTGAGDLTTFSAAIDGSDVVTISSTGGSANKKITVASHYLIQ